MNVIGKNPRRASVPRNPSVSHENVGVAHKSTMKAAPKRERSMEQYVQQMERRLTRSMGHVDECSMQPPLTKKAMNDKEKGQLKNEIKEEKCRERCEDGKASKVVKRNKQNEESAIRVKRSDSRKRSKMEMSTNQSGQRKQEKIVLHNRITDRRATISCVGDKRRRRKHNDCDHSETRECEAKEIKVNSPSIKTRRWTKMRMRLIPRCRICRGDSEGLMKCMSCRARYHLECLEYEAESARSVAEGRMENWLCPMCVVCAACNLYITDPENMQCVSCDRAYHGSCKPNSAAKLQSREPAEPFYCPQCVPNKRSAIKNEEMDSSTTTHQSIGWQNSSVQSSRTNSSCTRTRRNNVLFFRTAINTKQQWQQQRDQTVTLAHQRPSSSDGSQLQHSVRLAPFPFVSENSSEKKINDRLKDEVLASSTKARQIAKTQRTVSSGRVIACLGTSHTGKISMDLESNSPQKVKEVDESGNSDNEDVPLPRKGLKGGKLGQGRHKLQQFSTTFDYQLFMEAKAKLREELGKESEEASTNKENVREQWVHYANHEMKAVNESPFPKAIARSPHLYICHFCLQANITRDRYDVHMQHCLWYHPPGNEIYREGELSFWEIDGADEVKYCTRLCLLSILFLPSKVAYRDTETFTFYLLTEATDRGHLLVGYFSKEKRPSQNNNLSCLLVLPLAQRAGYGKLLIDLSYKLSLRERKIGGPEHPLSDLGLLTYRSYWKAAIICYVRKNRGRSTISVKEISYETGIHAKDIVSTLTLYNLLRSANDSYYIDVKKVLRLPLRSFRHRVVHDDKLIWEPQFDADKDPSKMGAYTD